MSDLTNGMGALGALPERAALDREAVEDELARVGGGSTRWLAIVSELEQHTDFSDATFAEGLVDWTAVWNQYVRVMVLTYPSDEDDRLASAYNLIELDYCAWCDNPAPEHELHPAPDADSDSDTLYHRGCLVEHLAETAASRYTTPAPADTDREAGGTADCGS